MYNKRNSSFRINIYFSQFDFADKTVQLLRSIMNRKLAQLGKYFLAGICGCLVQPS